MPGRHPKREGPGRVCIEQGCANEAQHEGHHRKGGWSYLWCLDCDEKRIARITKNLEAIGEAFKPPPPEPTHAEE